MTKKTYSYIYNKWSSAMAGYRRAMHQNEKGLALFFKPPKLFDFPSSFISREILLEELQKRNLIK